MSISLNYSEIVASISLVGTVIGIPVSAYCSYHYAIKGERRKEWNTLSEPILSYFFTNIAAHKAGDFSGVSELPLEKIHLLSQRFSTKEILAFTPLFTRYMEIINKVKSTPSMGKTLGIEAALVAGSIQEIIKIK